MALLETLLDWPVAPEQPTIRVLMLRIVAPFVATVTIIALALNPNYSLR